MRFLSFLIFISLAWFSHEKCVQKGYFSSTDGTTCYRVFPKPKNYTAAATDCEEKLFAKHITVRNAFDTSSIRNFPNVAYPLWLGYNKGNPSGKWSWDNPSPKPVAYINFRPGADTTGDYAYMDSDGTWNTDKDGFLQASYICQYPDPTAAPCAGNTDYSWSYYCLTASNTCYSLIDTRDNFTNNEESCREEGGHLVKILSQQINDFVFNLIDWDYTVQFQVWIGLRNFNGVWQWTDGTPFNKATDYSNFFNNETVLEDGDCVSMKQYTGQWRMSDCAQKMYQSCQRGTLVI